MGKKAMDKVNVEEIKKKQTKGKGGEEIEENNKFGVYKGLSSSKSS